MGGIYVCIYMWEAFDLWMSPVKSGRHLDLRHLRVEGTFMCGKHLKVEGTVTCGRSCGRHLVEGEITCGMHSCRSGPCGRHLQVDGNTHVSAGI